MTYDRGSFLNRLFQMKFPGDEIGEDRWCKWNSLLKGTLISQKRLQDIARTIGQKWPETRQCERLKDFLGYALAEIYALPYVGPKKGRTLILCVAYEATLVEEAVSATLSTLESKELRCNDGAVSSPLALRQETCFIPNDSILECRLFDCYALTEQEKTFCEQGLDFLDLFTLQPSIELWASLRSIGFIENDDLLSFGSHSVTYFHLRLGIDHLLEIIDLYAKVLAGFIDRQVCISTEAYSARTFFSMPQLTYLMTHKDTEDINEIDRIAIECGVSVVALNEAVLIQTYGVSARSIQLISKYWQLSDYAVRSLRYHNPILLTPFDSNGFTDFIVTWASRRIVDKDYINIAVSRLGWRGSKATLDDLASQYNCSRERVRQIEKYAVSKISHANSRSELFLLYSELVGVLLSAGGNISTLSAIHHVTSRIGWQESISVQGFIHLLDIAMFSLIEYSPEKLRLNIPLKLNSMISKEILDQETIQLVDEELQQEEVNAPCIEETSLDAAEEVIELEDIDNDTPNVFPQVEPTNPHFIWLAASAIRAKASNHGFLVNKRWSMVELAFTETDYQLLRAWGEKGTLTRKQLDTKANVNGLNMSGREVMGLLIIVFTAEIGRRDAAEGELWPYLYQVLCDDIRLGLMTKTVDHAYPKPWLKNEIEKAYRQYNLRHVFDSDGTQAWIRSAYLQFGITSQGLKRLPWWLCGHGVPAAINDLTGKGDNRSPLFAQLWNILQECRWGAITAAEARRQLVNNPWIPPVGLESVMTATLGKQHVRRIQTEIDSMEEPPSLLSKPRLSIDGDPVFLVRLSENLPAWMTEPHYVLVLDDSTRVTISRDEDGDYILLGGELRLQPTKPLLLIKVFNQGKPIFEEPIPYTLWDADEEFTFFKNGNRTPENVVKSGSGEYDLICSADLKLSHPAVAQFNIFSGAANLFSFARGIPADFEIQFEEKAIWVIPEASQTLPTGLVANISVISASLPRGRWGDDVSLLLNNLPSGFEPRKLMLSGFLPLDINNEGGRFTTSMFTLTAGITKFASAYIVGYEHGRLCRKPVQLHVGHLFGLARESIGGWEPCDTTGVLDKAELGSGRILAVPPEPSLPGLSSEWCFTEQYRFLTRPDKAGNCLTSCLTGLGSQLYLRKGPYNKFMDQPEQVFKAVIDTGIISSAKCQEGDWTVSLRRDIEFGPDYDVWVWYSEKDIPEKLLNSCVIPDSSRSWRILSETITEGLSPLSFAVSYKGNRMGVAWCGKFSFRKLSELIRTSPVWEDMAPWLAWWHVPILMDEFKQALKQHLTQNASQTLYAWLAKSSAANAPPVWIDPATGWRDVIRAFFHNCLPSPQKSAELLKQLKMLTGEWMDDEDEGWYGYDLLLETSPILLISMAQKGVELLYSKPAHRQDVLHCLKRRVLGMSENEPLNSTDLKQKKAELLASACHAMGSVDSNFITISLLREARELISGTRQQPQNLDFCLDVQPFRDWLVLELL